MGWIETTLLVVQLLAAIGVIVLVLLQHGKGADMGAAFGSGTSGSLFGASGSANFLSRTTAVFAAVFFACTLGLALIAAEGPTRDDGGVMGDLPVPAGDLPASTVPATPSPAAPPAGSTPATQTVPQTAPQNAPAPASPAPASNRTNDIPK